MKNKILKAIVSAVLVTVAASCTITHVEYNEINPDIFPSSESDVAALVNGSAYHGLSVFNVFNTAAGYLTNSDMVTDYAENSWGWTTVYNTYEANDWHIDGDWRRVYDYVTFISAMRLDIERIKPVNINEDLKNRFIAELKCGIGFMGYIMYDMYGPIPIPDIEILQNPQDMTITPRLSEEEMQNFIETNLLEAAEVLPYSYDAENYGRFTKGLAKTLLMKLYMMTSRWADAEAIGREITTDPRYGYELEPDYASLFSLSNEHNKEVIYASCCKEGVVYHKWFAHVLPSDYPTGNDITKWGGFKISWPAYFSFEEGDKRLKTIIASYTASNGQKHNYEFDRNSGSIGILYYGAIPLKYDLASGGVTGEECEIDVPIYRYADVLTLLAEAIVRNSGSVSQEAIDLLNMVRTTHGGLPAYTAADMPNPKAFLGKLLDERGHEFYYEGIRRTDLIRHGKFISAAQAKARWAGLPEEAIQSIGTMADGRYKYERLPIPTKIINEGKGIIEQNPGY